MREYNRYDEYKDSGVEWIGEIPENWEINKSKFISEVLLSNINKKTNEYEPKVLLCNYTDVYYNDFIDLNINFMKASTSYDKKKKLHLEVGDVIITKDSESPNDIGIPTYVNETKKNLVCGYHLAMLKPYKNIISGKFLFRLLESKLLKNQFSMKSTGITRHSISLDTIKNIILLLPPKKEQQKIALFLDQKTTEIDKIINKKETLIDKLEKYKKSVITEAVTKGKLGDKYINEDGELVDKIEMEDSGVEWISEIPEYCEPIRLKYILDKIEYGLSESSSGDGEYKILTMGNISDGKIILPEQGSLDNIDENYLLKNKNLLFNRTNSMEQIAKVGIFRGNKKDKVTFASYLVRLVPNKNNNNEFINYMLNNYKFLDYAKSYAIPSINQANLNPTRYTNLFIIRFPLGVQQSLVEKINLKTEQIEKIIQKTKQSIEKYKEYKKSLIFEAVTGKIDLRDYELEGGEKLAEHNNSSETERERLSAVD